MLLRGGGDGSAATDDITCGEFADKVAVDGDNGRAAGDGDTVSAGSYKFPTYTHGIGTGSLWHHPPPQPKKKIVFGSALEQFVLLEIF